jgi:hypothetical protein
MAGEKLHDYDLQLCDYVAANVQQHLDEPLFVRLLDQVAAHPELWLPRNYRATLA